MAVNLMHHVNSQAGVQMNTFQNCSKRFCLYLLVLIFSSPYTALFFDQVLAAEPSENAVVFEQNLLLPAMQLVEGPGTPLCMDGANGLLVAGCAGIQGPEGPKGPQGDSGISGNQALAQQSCPEGDLVTGFDEVGDIVCSPVMPPE